MDTESALVRFDAFDVVDLLLTHGHGLLPIDSAGVLVADQDGALKVLRASSEETRLLELLELQGGPGQAAFTSRQPVEVPQLTLMADRWPGFVREARRLGVSSAHAFPLRADDVTIGAFTVFSQTPAELSTSERAIAQALTGLATLAVINADQVRSQGELSRQLQRALDSRVVIEQAKGIIAVQQSIDVGTAFRQLRRAARSAGRTLPELSADVVAGRVPVPRVDRPDPATRPRGRHDPLDRT